MTMSKPKTPHNGLSVFEQLILGVLLIPCFPIIIITIVITLCLGKYNKKGRLILITGITLLLLTLFFFPSVIESFIKEIITAINIVVESITKKDFKDISSVVGLLSVLEIYINIYTNFSLTSFGIMLLISLSYSGYLLHIQYKNMILTETGVISFNGSIEEMYEKSNNLSSPNSKEETTGKTLIGTNPTGRPIYCDDKAKHVFVCGTTGSGKTVLLSNYIKSGLSKNYGMLLIDGKGDIDSGSIMDITKRFSAMYNRKLYVIDMNNPSISAKYNPFTGASETICKDMLINMTDWSEEHYKTNTERYIQRLLKLFRLQGGLLSFKRIANNMSTSKFEELSSILAKEGLITKEEHISNLELIKASGKIAENAAARFTTIAESDIGTIFDEDGIDIITALNQNAVILFILNPLIYPELSTVMGRLILIDSKKAISHMFGQYEKRKFFIFDEINVYASTVLIDLINKSRSAGVTSIPATQSLADLEAVAGEPFKQQIIENCNNYVVLRQNSPKSAEEWAKTLGTRETMQITYQINNSEPSNVGTARKTREFIIHPDEIKALPTGKGIFLSKDNGRCERIKVIKPF